MPANAVADTRAALATAFSSLSATCYSSVPESPIPPAIVIVPDSPYMEVVLIGKALAGITEQPFQRLKMA